MAAWSAWFPDLMPHLPGCPAPIVEHELKRAAQRFFEHTRAWRVMIDPIAVAAGPGELDIVPDDPQQELVRIEEAWLDGKGLDPETVDSLEKEFGGDWISRTGTPNAYWLQGPEEFRLFPKPVSAAATGLTCRLSVKPSESASGIPDNLARKYRNQILTGAKSLLMLYLDKPWTNVEMGAALGASFQDMSDTVKTQVAKGFGRGRISSSTTWC
jgi:hypothetical protein